MMLLGGQETGNAWGAVLFGHHAPTGRSPVMMPASAKDQIDPSPNVHIKYTEGFRTSYRNPAMKAAFPFGHGLTYTTFGYTGQGMFECGNDLCVRVLIRNTGIVAAQTVPQLYLEFPPECEHHSYILKGFEKTDLLQPGETVSVTFHLGERDCSCWRNGWQLIPATRLTAHVGASSADLRVS